jgi:CRP-like cAMP-binding protein
MHQLEIPEDELTQFEPYLKVYTKGATILREGEFDERIFLLRQGDVSVYKTVGDHSQYLSNILAINFFGEMSAFTRRPRSATIVAATDLVAVYAFDKLNMAAVFSNEKWSSLLVTRLISDMQDRLRDFEHTHMQINRLQSLATETMGTMLYLLNGIPGMDTKSRQVLLVELPKLIDFFFAETQLKPSQIKLERLSSLRKRQVISDEMYCLIVATRAPSRTGQLNAPSQNLIHKP